ncbi:MAG: branched-chain amino acid transporter AzlD [Glaciihabitans sp.]|jgi:hypothetical protein|nr:branched-chain amino acid transporter AzlD [Glaciihabitans sp.]
MNTWTIVLLASICVLVLKIAGYLVPPKVVEKPAPTRITALLTIALLAGLVSIETLGSGSQIVLDARVPAVLVAAALFALRVPFVLVIIAAAVVAALIRLWA